MGKIREHIDSIGDWMLRHPVASFVLAGLLMGSAFLHSTLWWAGFVGLTLFFALIPHTYSKKETFWYGTLAGTVKTLVSASWVWYVYPLTWMGDFSPVSQLFGIGWMWVTGSIAVGLSLGIFAILVRPYLAHRYRYALVPSAYVVAELLGSLFFSIAQYGPGGTVNVHTSFGYLGYTFGAHDLIGFFARAAGVYGLSFGIAAFALFLGTVFIRHLRQGFPGSWRHALILLVPLIVVFTYFIPVTVGDTDAGIRVATVNTQFENTFDMTALDRADRVRMIIDAFRVALTSGSDIIVFPETSYSLMVFGRPENVIAYIESQTSDDVLVVDSDKLTHTDGTSAVRAVLYDTERNEVYTAFKKFLVPSGEYVPYQLSLMMSLTGFKETSDAIHEALEFVPGGENMYSTDRPLPGVLFCSESVSPIQAFRVAQESTLPLIVHPVSHAWLNEPITFWHQLDLMLRTQARFARLPIIQASNMAEPQGYDRYGTPLQGETIFETASTSVVVYEV